MKIGVVINLAEDFKTGAMPSYTDMRTLAQTADAGGLDSIWVFDHLLFRMDDRPGETRGIWECWTLLCALAEATEKVELGTIVLCNPFRNPALLAKMAHTLDEISSGRLILGLGAGWHKPEFDAFGFPFDYRAGRFDEALQIIKPLLAGERISFDGKHYQIDDCLIKPLGPRPGGIPIMVGAGRPRMLGLTARYADSWNTAWLGQPDELAARREVIEAACAEVGRDPATLDITVGVQVLYPDLADVDAWTEKPLGGTADELAHAFHGYEEAGAAHLILNTAPSGMQALERVIAGVQKYKTEKT